VTPEIREEKRKLFDSCKCRSVYDNDIHTANLAVLFFRFLRTFYCQLKTLTAIARHSGTPEEYIKVSSKFNHRFVNIFSWTLRRKAIENLTYPVTRKI
jgi:hypothetical protein